MSKDSALTNLELKPSDTNIKIRFVGELNENLKFVEKTFNVKIFQNGNNLLKKNKFKEALEKFLKAEKLYYADKSEWSKIPEVNGYDLDIVEASPDNVYFNIGVCYANLNNKKKALEYFKKAFTYNYRHTTAKYNAAVIHKEFGEIDQAIKLLNEATTQNPRFKFIMDQKLKK